jgi:hypothetical protein
LKWVRFCRTRFCYIFSINIWTCTFISSPSWFFSTERMISKKEIIHSASIHHKHHIVAYDKYVLKILFPNHSYNKDKHFYNVDRNTSCWGYL